MLPATDGSVFRLTRLAMTRAVEIHLGSPALVEHLANEKPTTIALREIAEGKIGFKTMKPKAE